MRVVSIDEERRQQAFAERAALHFEENPGHWSFTDGEIEPEALLALRWGLHNRAVLVVKLDAGHTPTVYGDLIRQGGDA